MSRNTSTCLAGIVCASGLLFPWPTRPCLAGGPIPFRFAPDGPTIVAADGRMSYDAATGELRATALPLALSSALFPGPGFVRISGNAQLRVDVFVNPDWTLRAGNDGFTLTGTISIGGSPLAGTLLEEDVTATGAGPAGPPTWAANALMDTTGGLLTESQPLADGTVLPALFPLGGPPVGMDCFAENVTGGTLGDSTQDSSSSRVKFQVGTTSVAEPKGPVLAVIAIAILAFLGLGRKRVAPAA